MYVTGVAHLLLLLVFFSLIFELFIRLAHRIHIQNCKSPTRPATSKETTQKKLFFKSLCVQDSENCCGSYVAPRRTNSIIIIITPAIRHFFFLSFFLRFVFVRSFLSFVELICHIRMHRVTYNCLYDDAAAQRRNMIICCAVLLLGRSERRKKKKKKPCDSS